MTSESSQASLRTQLFVDRNVQSELLRRAFYYTCGATVYFLTIIIVEEAAIYEDRGIADILREILDQTIYWLPGLLMLVPVMVYDLLRVSHRFAGPIYSLRRELRRLADGESRRPLHFREGDYWADMARSFNEIRDELLERRTASTESQPIPVLPPGFEKVATREQLFGDEGDDEDNLDIDVPTP